ncbi:MAG: sigma-70 family RNA polymerase sigma factor [Trebonia sp.]|jgi:RNA polymerase sigma-70 factor (ECF subfamily)
MREDEFAELAAAHQSELRAHCYRMLGSVHDAEDALQEALVRAWKGIDRFAGRGSVRSWLYSIATNTALDIARQRSRREFAVDHGDARRAGRRAGRAAHRAALAAGRQSALRALGDRGTRDLVRRYADAMEPGDIETLVGMLTQGVTWSMPPVPTWYQGLPSVRDFLVRYPLTDRWKHRPARANGQLAVAGYAYDEDAGRFIPGAIDVLTIDGDKIAAVTGFLTADLLGRADSGGWIPGAELFARFGLPAGPP